MLRVSPLIDIHSVLAFFQEACWTMQVDIMANKMLIDATHSEETRVVVVDGNNVEEFDFESQNNRQIAGNIYLANITRVEPSLQAAFIDYGGNRHGFLAFSEIHPDYYQFNYNSRQKNSSATVPSVTNMVYGDMALVLLNPFRISANRIFSLSLFLNSSASKSDFTNSAFWFSTFPHLPMSNKPNGMRMGNGAGKLSNWYTQVRTGNTLIEFNNLSLGRAAHYAKQTAHNLPVPSTFTCHNSSNLNLVGASRTNPSLIAFW